MKAQHEEAGEVEFTLTGRRFVGTQTNVARELDDLIAQLEAVRRSLGGGTAAYGATGERGRTFVQRLRARLSGAAPAPGFAMAARRRT